MNANTSILINKFATIINSPHENLQKIQMIDFGTDTYEYAVLKNGTLVINTQDEHASFNKQVFEVLMDLEDNVIARFEENVEGIIENLGVEGNVSKIFKAFVKDEIKRRNIEKKYLNSIIEEEDDHHAS